MVTEMTGSYSLIVPSMLVCISAYVVGRRWGMIKEQVRGAAESPAHAGDLVVHTLQSWSVGKLVDRTRATIVAPETSLTELMERIQFGESPVFVVVRRGRLLGLISASDLQRLMDEPMLADVVIAEDVMRKPDTILDPQENVYRALNELRHSQDGFLPVVDPQTQRFLGVMTREGVAKAVRGQIRRLRGSIMREHSGLIAIEQEGQLHELVSGVAPEGEYGVRRFLVPLQAIGRSLREADFRREFGVQVIAIELADGSIQCPPDIDAPLRTEQRLVALVQNEEHSGGKATPPDDKAAPSPE
jgi:CBS domain-containing protein